MKDPPSNLVKKVELLMRTSRETFINAVLAIG